MDSENINNETEIDNQADVMRIMISTDNHLGYGEKDAIRGKAQNINRCRPSTA